MGKVEMQAECQASQPHGSFRKAFMVVDCNEVKNIEKESDGHFRSPGTTCNIRRPLY